MSAVIDASVVVSGLIAAAPEGDWALEVLQRPNLAAPQLLPFEVLNVLGRLEHGGRIDTTLASFARLEFSDLPIALVPLEALADRVWALRSAITAYDASYVALAEALELPHFYPR